ncbi:retrovirus-related pol polyprotein from transposon TNT 1-94 [Tanacetum coccineum]
MKRWKPMEMMTPMILLKSSRLKTTYLTLRHPCAKHSMNSNLLKTDMDLFTFNIKEIKTYEEYELNNNMMGDVEEPWNYGLNNAGNIQDNMKEHHDPSICKIKRFKMMRYSFDADDEVKNDLRKFKGKDIVDDAAQMSNATTIAPGMYKLDPIVEQAKLLNPLDSASYTVCKYVKLIQELLGYVRDTCPNIPTPRVKPSTSASGSKPLGNTKNNRISRTPSSNKKNKVEVQSRKVKSSLNKNNSDSKNVCNEHVKHPVKGAKALCSICNECLFDDNHVMCLVDHVNSINMRAKSATKKNKKRKEWKPTGKSVVQIVLWYLDSGCSKHMTGDRSQLTNFVHKFLGIVKFGNDQVAKIMGSQGTNLYYISIREMMTSSLICLLSKVTKTKSWLWHCRLPHLNFGDINHLARHGLVRGLPRLKFAKHHLCSAYAMGKSKKQSHKPKSEDTNQEKLYLLHMNLCGPMHVASVNGKKYILVIVDDYSRFTWVKFLASKDEAPEFIIKFMKIIQVRLSATVRNICTDNRTEFVNQTLRDYYEQVAISHETSIARTPQQNGVVERRNCTLVEAA